MKNLPALVQRMEARELHEPPAPSPRRVRVLALVGVSLLLLCLVLRMAR